MLYIAGSLLLLLVIALWRLVWEARKLRKAWEYLEWQLELERLRRTHA